MKHSSNWFPAQTTVALRLVGLTLLLLGLTTTVYHQFFYNLAVEVVEMHPAEYASAGPDWIVGPDGAVHEYGELNVKVRDAWSVTNLSLIHISEPTRPY